MFQGVIQWSKCLNTTLRTHGKFQLSFLKRSTTCFSCWSHGLWCHDACDPVTYTNSGNVRYILPLLSLFSKNNLSVVDNFISEIKVTQPLAPLQYVLWCIIQGADNALRPARHARDCVTDCEAAFKIRQKHDVCVSLSNSKKERKCLKECCWRVSMCVGVTKYEICFLIKE